MITKPALLVMAAGMGSRYGGLKQIDPIGDRGEIILDFSLYDAKEAGFRDVVFVIKKENEEAFRQLMEGRAGRYLNIHYAFQELEDLPPGFSVPEGREKPWGTGHAVMAAREIIGGPFAVINSDDYYGWEAFIKMFQFLTDVENEDRAQEKYPFSMVAYQLSKTLSETGHVARGVCEVSPDDKLLSIVERTKIMRQGEARKQDVLPPICFTENDGETWTRLQEDTPVSMNFWGFTSDMMDELVKGFPEFLKCRVPENPMKAEYFLPGRVDALLKEEKAEVTVLRSSDQWYGVTYKEDKPGVKAALLSLKEQGFYPPDLWK